MFVRLLCQRPCTSCLSSKSSALQHASVLLAATTLPLNTALHHAASCAQPLLAPLPPPPHSNSQQAHLQHARDVARGVGAERDLLLPAQHQRKREVLRPLPQQHTTHICVCVGGRGMVAPSCTLACTQARAQGISTCMHRAAKLRSAACCKRVVKELAAVDPSAISSHASTLYVPLMKGEGKKRLRAGSGRPPVFVQLAHPPTRCRR